VSPSETLIVLLAGSIIAGFLGSLTGLGGGVVIVPLLTLALHVDVRYAVGASIVSVIATSSAAAATYSREGFTNLRLAMFLEVATTFGAIGGAVLATHLPTEWIAAVFGLVLLFSGAQALRTRRPEDRLTQEQSSKLAKMLRLPSEFPGTDGTTVRYGLKGVRGGFALMALAGGLSGMLGIGSGGFKVLAMDGLMKVPFKVSTTTSNFMIGVTAAASAGVYMVRGYIEPRIAAPVMLGVLVGAAIGTRFLMRLRSKSVRRVFAVLLMLLGIYMAWSAGRNLV
jgi:uncharacterized membrane protein YfcA